MLTGTRRGDGVETTDKLDEGVRGWMGREWGVEGTFVRAATQQTYR